MDRGRFKFRPLQAKSGCTGVEYAFDKFMNPTSCHGFAGADDWNDQGCVSMMCRGFQWPYEMALIASLTGVGCTSFNSDAESQWRQATVVGVLSRTQLGTHVDARCVDSATSTPSDEVVLVKYRVGRAPYPQAVVLSNGRALPPGDTVAVHPSRCAMK